MIAKHAHTFGADWDLYLQQLLFAYSVRPQDSTGEAPFLSFVRQKTPACQLRLPWLGPPLTLPSGPR